MSCHIYDELKFVESARYGTGPRSSNDHKERVVEIYENTGKGDFRAHDNVPRGPQNRSNLAHSDQFKFFSAGLGLLCLIVLIVIGFLSYYYVLLTQHNTTTESCSEAWTRFGSSDYFVSTEQRNWTESREDCLKRGAELVVISSDKEKRFVSGLKPEEDLWVGLKFQKSKQTWTWVDGSSYSYRAWATGVNAVNVEYDGAVAFVMDTGNWNYTQHGLKHWLCERNTTCS